MGEPIKKDGPLPMGKELGNRKNGIQNHIPWEPSVHLREHLLLRGVRELCEFFGVPERIIYVWILRYGLPVSKAPMLPGKDNLYLPVKDAMTWLTLWRPREFLVKTNQIQAPPEAADIINRVCRRSPTTQELYRALIAGDRAERKRLRLEAKRELKRMKKKRPAD